MSGCIIKCSFCPTLDLIYNGLRQGRDREPKMHHHYSCDTCYSEFFYDSSFKLVGWSFRIDYKGDRFGVNWFQPDGNTLIFKNGYVITTMSNRAALTPFNLAQKLPTILTFL